MEHKTFYDSWNQPTEIIDQAGRGLSIDDYRSFKNNGVTATSYQPATVLKALRKDEILQAAIVTKVDATLGPGWFLTGSNQQELQRARNFLEDAQFDLVLQDIFYNLYAYGNAFVEIVRDENGDPRPELYILETTEMEIVDEEGHGVPNKYIQRHAGQVIEFDAEDVVHFRMNRFDTSLWGEIPIRALDQVIGIKMQLKNHLWRLFKDNAFRETIHFPKGTNDDDINRSISEYELSKKDPRKPYIWFGDGVEHKMLMSFEDGPRFMEMWTRCDLAILSNQQVPPIMAGIPDSSGRASGEQQTYKAFNTHIKGNQRTVAHNIIFNLFQKLGFKSTKFVFNELDRKSEKDVMEMAVQFKAMGAKPDKLTEWLQAQGLNLPEDFFDEGFFVSPAEQAKQQQAGEQQNIMMKNAISNKAGSPSRMGKNGARKNIGTGSESSTRQKQIITQAIDTEVEAAFERLTLSKEEKERIEARARELLAQGLAPQ
jgi:hypothetical protein